MKVFAFYSMLPRATWVFVAVFYFLSYTVSAQPSGGPYGPVKQSYELPIVKGKIYYVSPDGQAKSDGLKVNRPTSFETAIKRVVSGDAIVLRGGTYRTGSILLNQGIVMQPYKDEEAVLKGTFVAAKWEKLNDNLWVTKWDRLFPMKPESWWRREREEKNTPLHRFNNDMVFVDGRFLQSAGNTDEVNENTFYVDYGAKKVYIGVDPTDKLIEITAFNFGMKVVKGDCHGKKPDKRGPVIRGITFTQFAYYAIEVEGYDPEGISPESEHGQDIIGTTLEHCHISYCSRVGGYFRGDSMVIRNCKVSNTSTEGIFILASNDVLLENNIFASNNIERITGYYPAAVKIFNQCYRVVCRNNLVIDHPFSNGIWYDVGNVDGIFINNHIENIGSIEYEIREDQVWPSDNGFFFEISKGVICAGNVFVNCDQGLLILNASDAHIYNNTFINSIATFGLNARSAEGDHFGWHPATGPGIDERHGHMFVNNILYGDKGFKRPLLFVWQVNTLCDRVKSPMFSQLDNNIYLRNQGEDYKPLILWGPFENERCQIGFNAPFELNAVYSGFSASSKLFDNESTLFMGFNEKNYRVRGDFQNIRVATEIPGTIGKWLKAPVGPIYFGAYPFE